jgi:microcin C transport system permease protein
MGAYILRRLLLMIPTLLGIMVVNFALTQFVPGGPVEQVLAQLEGEGDVFAGISGGGNEGGSASEIEDSYQGARGLPPQFLDELRVQFNFARIVCEEGFTGEPDLDAEECVAEDIPGIERFGLMMWDYMRFDFGESYFRSISVSTW